VSTVLRKHKHAVVMYVQCNLFFSPFINQH